MDEESFQERKENTLKTKDSDLFHVMRADQTSALPIETTSVSRAEDSMVQQFSLLSNVSMNFEIKSENESSSPSPLLPSLHQSEFIQNSNRRGSRSRQLPNRFNVKTTDDQSRHQLSSPKDQSIPSLSTDPGHIGDNEAHVYSMIYHHLQANMSNPSDAIHGTPNQLNRQFSPLMGFSADKNGQNENATMEPMDVFLPNHVASDLNEEDGNTNAVLPLLPPLGGQNGHYMDSSQVQMMHQQPQPNPHFQHHYFNNRSNLELYSQQMPMQLMSFGPFGLQPIFPNGVVNTMSMPQLHGMSSIHPHADRKNINTTSAESAHGSTKKRKTSDQVKKPRKPQKRFMNSNDDSGDFGTKRDGIIRLTTNQPRKVEVLDMNYNRIHLFDSCSEASRAMNVNRTRISRVCRGGGGELTNKIYRYVEVPEMEMAMEHTVESSPAPSYRSSFNNTEEIAPPPLPYPPALIEYNLPLEPTATDEEEREVLEDVPVVDDDDGGMYV